MLWFAIDSFSTTVVCVDRIAAAVVCVDRIAATAVRSGRQAVDATSSHGQQSLQAPSSPVSRKLGKSWTI